MQTILKNGNIVTANNIYKADILLENGVISQISDKIEKVEAKVVDVQNTFILPGGVDMHTQLSLDSHGKFSADAFKKNSIAALYGGITTVVEEIIPMSCNIESLSYYKDALENNSFVDYSFHQNCHTPLSPDTLKELINQTLDGFPSCVLSTFGEKHMSDEDIVTILRDHSCYGGTALIKCDSNASSMLLEELHTLKQKTAPYSLATAHPYWGEKEGFDRMCNLSRAGGVAFCIDHISSKEVVKALYQQIGEGLPVTITTSPLHLIFTDSKYQSHELNDRECYKYIALPPLRKKEDINALWKGINDGVIHFITTHHNSTHLENKLNVSSGNAFKCPLGTPGIELRLPILFTEGVVNKKISITRLAEITASHVTRTAGLRNKGRIEVGTDADLVILDPNMKKEIKLDHLHENCDYSPYEGLTLQGFPQHVFLRGSHVINDYKFCAQETTGKLTFRKAVAVR